jgi:predicted transposase YdaD
VQKGLQEGRQEGRQEGLQLGLCQALGATLRRLLERDAGPLPPAVIAQIDVAKPEQLQSWLDRAINGDPPLELLGEAA